MIAFLEKFKTVNDSFDVSICDNGYVLQIGGKTHNDDWINKKIVCTDLNQLFDLITLIDSMDSE